MSHRDDFDARALQIAFDLTIHNTYEGKMGQGYNEARAHDIRRIYNILCGRAPEEQAVAQPAAPLALPAPARTKRRKKDEGLADE